MLWWLVAETFLFYCNLECLLATDLQKLHLFINCQVDHDIITVDNIHAWVDPPPRGPDVFTVNVESALNFSGR